MRSRRILLFLALISDSAIESAVSLSNDNDNEENSEEMMDDENWEDEEEEEEGIQYDPLNEDPVFPCRRDPTWKSMHNECEEVTGWHDDGLSHQEEASLLLGQSPGSSF